MRRLTPSFAVALLSLTLARSGCGRERRGATVRPASPAGPRDAKAVRKLAGRTFRINAASGVADPMTIKAALESGGPLPSGIQEVDRAGRPMAGEANAAREAVRAAGPGGTMGLPGAMVQGRSGPALSGQPDGAVADGAVAMAAKKQLLEFYEVVTGKPVRVLSVTAESGMWRFVLSVSQGGKQARQLVYVTGDGRTFFEGGGVHLRSELALVKADKRFATCLVEKKVRVFGDPRGKTTLQQLKVIGKFAGVVFIDCAKNPKNCAKLGVEKLPTVAVGDDLTPGVQNRAFLESATGCK